MSVTRKIVLSGCLGIVAFDALASIASRLLNFPYPYATVGSFVIYAVVGFTAARISSVKAAALAGAMVGLTEATVGWGVSWLIGPGRVSNSGINLGTFVLTVILVSLVAGGIGAVGGAVGRRYASTSPPAV